jgi:hypothetical protein
VGSCTHEFSVRPIVVKNDMRFRFLRDQLNVQLSPHVNGRDGAIIHQSMFGDASSRQAVCGKLTAWKDTTKGFRHDKRVDPIKFVAGTRGQNGNDMDRVANLPHDGRTGLTIVKATRRFTQNNDLLRGCSREVKGRGLGYWLTVP